MTQQLFKGMLEKNHTVVDRCTKTAISIDNSHDVTSCFLLKQQPLSSHFRNLIVHLQMLTNISNIYYAHDS